MSDDYWFYRNRQLDSKDQQDATERELERMRLRSGFTRHEAGAEVPIDEYGLDAGSSQIVDRILKTRWELLDAVRRLAAFHMYGWRIGKWESILREPDPWQRQHQGRLQQMAHEVESMLNTGTGMFLIHSELESIRSKLAELDALIDAWHSTGDD